MSANASNEVWINSKNESVITNCSNCTNSGEPFELGHAAEAIIYIAYVLAIVLGASGNITSILVFVNGRRCNTDIKGFLINLAVADLMMALICIPFSFTSALIKVWVFSEPMCPIILFTQVLSVTVSVYTNTAISVDRFIAIKFPLKLMRASRRHVTWTIIAIWVVSTGLSAIQLWKGKVVLAEDGVTKVCTEKWPDPKSRRAYTSIVLVITYIIPVTFILTMYVLACFHLWFWATPGVGDHARDARQLNTKRKVIKMLIVMIVLFAVCWMPLHIFFLINDFEPELLDRISPEHTAYLYYSVHWLAMSNSFQNPIIYGFLNDNFRSDLAELLIKCCPPLTRVKWLQKVALGNQPLSRLSTRMTVMTDKMDSRAEIYRNGKRPNFNVELQHSAKPEDKSGVSLLSSINQDTEEETNINNNHTSKHNRKISFPLLDETTEEDNSLSINTNCSCNSSL